MEKFYIPAVIYGHDETSYLPLFIGRDLDILTDTVTDTGHLDMNWFALG